MPKVFLVGAGPGDPDLLTRKAARILETAEVVLHDRLCGEGVLALIPRGAKRIDVGKHEGEQEATQRRILRLLVHYAKQGRRVVRLKGGDPMIFGRGGEEASYLQERGIEVELVPGVSSAFAVPELAGIPLTFRGVATSFAVATGHCRGGCNDQWRRYAGIDTLVVLMGVKHRAEIAKALIEAGRSGNEPVAFVENGSTPLQRVIRATLAEVAAGAVEVEAPAVFVVGGVTRLGTSARTAAASAA